MNLLKFNLLIKKILMAKWQFKFPVKSNILVYDADPNISYNLIKILKKDTYQEEKFLIYQFF